MAEPRNAAAKELTERLKSHERSWTIEQRARRQLELGTLIKPLEEERKTHSEHLQAHMAVHDLGNKAEIGGVVCTIIPVPGKATIDKNVLIEKGVSIDVIEAATKTAPGFTQFRTSVPKET